MKMACLIPARGGSKAIPKKNIKDFCGMALLYWSILQAQKSNCFGEEIYVSSDSEEILHIAQQYNAKIIKRPDNISNDTSPMINVIRHANTVMNADYTLLLQPTNPLRFNNDIVNVVNIIKYYNDIKNMILICTYKGTYYNYNEYNPIECHNRQEHEKDIVSGLIYCFTRESLYSDKKEFIFKNYNINRWQANEIDDVEDWDICEFLFRKKILDA